MENRRYWVDYAKAMGILLVVYGHVARGLTSAGIEIPKAFFHLADSIIYSFHMPLFFFLSGLFFYGSISKRGGKALVFSKIDTIVYPYIIWSIFQGLIEATLSSYTNGDVSYSQIFSLLWSPRAQFWFLYALFIVFVVASLIFSVVSKKAAMAVFLLSAVLYVYHFIMVDYLVFKFISGNFVFFAFGIIFSIHLKAELLSNRGVLCLLTGVFVIAQFVYHCLFALTHSNQNLASLLLAITSILWVVSLSSWASLKPNRFIVFVGSSSMGIYLMHILAGSGVRVILKTVMGVDSFIVHLLVGFIVGIGASLVALWLMDKSKIKYVFSAPVCDVFVHCYNKVRRLMPY